MRTLHTSSFIFALIGALNLGAVGMGHVLGFDGDILRILLGSWPEVQWSIYIFIGVSALWLLTEAFIDQTSTS